MIVSFLLESNSVISPIASNAFEIVVLLIPLSAKSPSLVKLARLSAVALETLFAFPSITVVLPIEFKSTELATRFPLASLTKIFPVVISVPCAGAAIFLTFAPLTWSIENDNHKLLGLLDHLLLEYLLEV